jgi:hypothetical protein
MDAFEGWAAAEGRAGCAGDPVGGAVYPALGYEESAAYFRKVLGRHLRS